MDTPPDRIQRTRLLGADVDLVTPDQVIGHVAACAAGGRKAVIANHNFHSLYLVRRSPRMAEFYERADLIEADSTPLIAWGRLMGAPIGRRHRCTYLDWREAFWAEATRQGWRVFFLGGEPGVAERAAEAIRGRWPRVELQVRDGYFDPAPDSPDSAALRQQIDAFRPDVILVGMGMPRQECWILDNMDRLERGVMLPIGGAFDFEAGATVTPPRWLGPVGLEWAFRLIHEPGRLFTRYLIEPWLLIPAALADLAQAIAGKQRTRWRQQPHLAPNAAPAK
jgi:N-acetylglucosaminyldiphosphoundecaprenol N-acetyl-beta-D-mannosaminyltransferase